MLIYISVMYKLKPNKSYIGWQSCSTLWSIFGHWTNLHRITLLILWGWKQLYPTEFYRIKFYHGTFVCSSLMQFFFLFCALNNMIMFWQVILWLFALENICNNLQGKRIKMNYILLILFWMHVILILF